MRYLEKKGLKRLWEKITKLNGELEKQIVENHFHADLMTDENTALMVDSSNTFQADWRFIIK